MPLKIGAGTSTLQIQLAQDDQTKAVALVTSTNFDKPVGPTVPTAWTLHPPPKPIPDFDRVGAHQSDPNWLPANINGEILPFCQRVLYLNPRGGFPIDGLCDAWNRFKEDERMDATYLALMTDVIPSMSDTLLRNNGLYDARACFDKMEQWSEKNPGVATPLTNSIAEAMRSSTFNSTVSLDIEFKRRPPKDGLRWIFARTATKMLHGGRMDVDVTICNEEMELLCTAHQLVLVLEAQRKFRRKKESVL